jgi:Ni/Fe-hydrogenase subunit HybB-like protein
MPDNAGAASARVVTKAPPWHGWVTADLSLNALATGIFAVAALCDLIAPAAYRPVIRAGYLVAFPLVLCDLICLILDLGDPLRFLHMLRVFKPGSPMSLGAWSTNAFAALAFAQWSGEIFDVRASAAIRLLVAASGLVAALVTAAYKGVLFSTTAQPGWKDARWLGTELSVSAGTLGTAFALAAAGLLEVQPAARSLRAALAMLLGFDLAATLCVTFEMRHALAARFTRAELARRYAGLIGGGVIAPLGLILISDSVSAAVAAGLLTLFGAIAMRHHLVAIPQPSLRGSSLAQGLRPEG